MLRIKSFIYEYSAKTANQTKKDAENPKIDNLTDDEWKNIQYIVDVLKIPYLVTKKLQRVNITLSDFYGEWLLMEWEIEQKLSCDSDYDLTENLSRTLNDYKDYTHKSNVNSSIVFRSTIRTNTYLVTKDFGVGYTHQILAKIKRK